MNFVFCIEEISSVYTGGMVFSGQDLIWLLWHTVFGRIKKILPHFHTRFTWHLPYLQLQNASRCYITAPTCMHIMQHLELFLFYKDRCYYNLILYLFIVYQLLRMVDWMCFCRRRDELKYSKKMAKVRIFTISSCIIFENYFFYRSDLYYEHCQ